MNAEGSLAVEGGATGLLFAPLTDCYAPHAEHDVVVLKPERAQVDVLTKETSGRWATVGSFFSGRLPITAAIPADVGGRAVILILVGDQEVVMMSPDLARAPRLRTPIKVYGNDGIRAIAAGDLDGDGSDELVVGRGGGIEIVNDMERSLYANPEDPPSLERSGIPDGISVVALGLATADVDGDGSLDVIALHESEALARIYDSPALDRDGPDRHWDVELAAVGTAVYRTNCGHFSAIVHDGDGDLVSVTTEATTVARDVQRVAVSRDAVLVGYGSDDLTLHNGCVGYGEPLDLSFGDAMELAIGPRLDGQRPLAALAADGRTVALYSVATHDF